MFKKLKLTSFVLVALAGTFALQSCLSGGWKVTRIVAKWNNSMGVLPRILIYIAFFILQVYTVTALIDSIVFNTIDFWNGTVTGMNKQYKKNGMDVAVSHSRTPLRQSIITTSKGDQVISVVQISELASGKIALTINGVLRGEVNSIHDIDPSLTLFKEDGKTLLLSKTFSEKDMKLAALSDFQNPKELLHAMNIVLPKDPLVSAK